MYDFLKVVLSSTIFHHSHNDSGETIFNDTITIGIIQEETLNLSGILTLQMSLINVV